MNPEPVPSLQDVLEAYALELENDNATLERYIRAYPQYAPDLVEVSRELERPMDVSTAPLDAEDRTLVQNAWVQLNAIADSNATNSLLTLEPAKMRSIASSLGIPRQILSAFREGRVIVESIPRLFLEHLAEALGTPYEALRSSLARAPNLVPSRSYKADEKPITPQQVSFEQLLIDACVPPDKRAALLAKKD
ncbi:MAG: hypothetical protein JNK23_08450 [Opitutaceae bacterium]|nr:hypothetical protein [Opitutaceae bacterium]